MGGSPGFRLGAALVAAVLAVAVAAPIVAPRAPDACRLEDELAPPSTRHWLGADADGCDIASRLVWGTRLSLGVGLGVVAISLALGVAAGLIAGTLGGAVDGALGFLMESVQAFPGILLAVAITAVFPERSVGLVILALSASGWVGYARLVRAQALALREADFVVAARALGMGETRIAVRQVLPNLLSPVIVQASFGMAGAVLAEAALSFLGLGAPAELPSWGTMLGEGRHYLLVAPRLCVYPGAAILLLVLAFNLLGDGLRDRLDPRLRRSWRS